MKRFKYRQICVLQNNISLYDQQKNIFKKKFLLNSFKFKKKQ